MLLVLCLALSPDKLIDSVFFLNEDMGGETSNRFFELSAVSTKLVVSESLLIGGQRKRVHKIMMFKKCWIEKNYFEPLKAFVERPKRGRAALPSPPRQQTPQYNYTPRQQAPSYNYTPRQQAPSYNYTPRQQAPSYNYTPRQQAPSYNYTPRQATYYAPQAPPPQPVSRAPAYYSSYNGPQQAPQAVKRTPNKEPKKKKSCAIM